VKEQGFDIRNAAKQKVLTRNEEYYYFARLRQLERFIADEQKDEWVKERVELVDLIIKSNIRFVVKVAHGYKRREGIPLDDLIAIGLVGLLNAIDLFDHATGNKFITFAIWHIRNCLSKEMINSMDTTSHFWSKTSKVDRLIEERGLSRLQVDSLTKVMEDEEIGEDEVESYFFVYGNRPSLDDPILFDGAAYSARTLSDVVADPNTKDEQTRLQDEEQKKILADAVKSLGKRADYIVSAHHGLRGFQPMTLGQIGRDIGYSRERVRQIYFLAIKKLKTMTELEELLD